MKLSVLKFSYALCFALLLAGCREKATIAGFDSSAWKNDRKSCKGVRTEMIDDVEKIRLQLYGMKEQQVFDILGRPDAEELYRNSQRFFFYYIQPGTQCQQQGGLSEANMLQVRMNALNKVSEITYKYPIPKEKQ
ncbi:MAG: outer membrane protein assembly factor BamE [Hymenobacteraceae bacterium]|nr:outer membrane protein assembly factor BamE [Hymenobacteraceae bacterium]MDX5396493.1 outer membrane protein assembly factor BamE [Hymenobacteraceae bacterium]MDX5443916.1 outer membrane protein assembly factor BamE [Hymenobacteraceae bacterium]MDX5512552.1 outer membrane protein assembly factor BamE [Hymenobacteraceae bacterium]